jgi:hypothetical protein
VTGKLPDAQRFMKWHLEDQNAVPIHPSAVPNQG